VRFHRLTTDLDVLHERLKENVKIRLPEALADAKEALDGGMAQIAEVTFALTMALAGIDPAKEYG